MNNLDPVNFPDLLEIPEASDVIDLLKLSNLLDLLNLPAVMPSEPLGFSHIYLPDFQDHPTAPF